MPPSQVELKKKITRVFGPPGTGKTTRLATWVAAFVAKYGPRSVMVTSFSVTAAAEVADRFKDATIRPDKTMTGTLHSAAMRAIGATSVALDPRVVVDWNGDVTPEWRITGDTRRLGGHSDNGTAHTADPAAAVTGDELLSALDRLRAGMVPSDEWPSNVREFAARWSAWKIAAGAVDFTDMTEGALERARDGQPPPGEPRVFISDEAQDMTPLEFALSRAWGALCDRWIIAGDDDQSINGWRGGDPRPLLALEGDDVQDIVLDRSYRVPEAVRAAAELWVRRLSRRRSKLYGSRLDEVGDVVTGAAFHVPHHLGSPELVDRVTADLDDGRTVMVLASCGYMLDKLIANLRAEGVPFHNPYRPAEAKWNPLGKVQENTVSTGERIARYLALAERDWTGADITTWMELVKLDQAGMRRGAKATAKRLDPDAAVPFEQVAALFADQDKLDAATEPSLDWLSAALLDSRRKVADYPLHVARRHGAGALSAAPRLTVGTIHSVKGGQADVVYLAPDVSAAARAAMTRPGGMDDAIRLLYVGMTRARAELRVLTPMGNTYLRPSQLLPPEMEVLPA